MGDDQNYYMERPDEYIALELLIEGQKALYGCTRDFAFVFAVDLPFKPQWIYAGWRMFKKTHAALYEPLRELAMRVHSMLSDAERQECEQRLGALGIE